MTTASTARRGPAPARQSGWMTGEAGPFRVTGALFFTALLLGGGGAPAPLMQAALEALGFAVLAYLLWADRKIRPMEASRGILLLVVAMLALALLHMVPLPPTLWAALPDRDIPLAVLREAGLGSAWMPLSLVPEGTRLAALQLIPAVAVLTGTYMATPAQRLSLSKIPILVAAVSGLVAAMQVASPGNAALYLFPRSVFTAASGLFANRNSQSDLLLCGILLCGLHIRAERIGRERDPRGRKANWTMVWLALIPLFAMTVLATVSRAGALFLGPVLFATFLLATGRRLGVATLAIATAAVGAVVLAFLLSPPFLHPVLSRFDSPNGRTENMPDMMFAIGNFLPLGSGLGSFDPVFRSVERLSAVSDKYFNHAHNDYIEIVLETGVPGAALLAIFLTMFGARAWRVWATSARSGSDWLMRVATMVLALLLAHSMVDYPLRTITLQCLFAFMCAALFPPRTRSTRAVGANA